MRMQNYSIFEVSILCYMLISISLGTGQECYNTGTFINHGAYGKNRNLILSTLASNVSANGGFYAATIGQDPNKVYALALCRGDSSSETCASSVNSTTQEIMAKCTNHKEAISWGGMDPPCIVRYANRSFFGILELFPIRKGCNVNNITSNLTEFYQTWESLMDGALTKASKGSSNLKFAAEEATVKDSEKIYALMQCTPDISQNDCETCLRQCVTYIKDNCHGNQGGNIQRPNCIFRWEFYRFYDVIADASPVQSSPLAPPAPIIISPPSASPNPTITKDKGGFGSGTIIIIVVSASIFMALATFTCVFLLRRKRKLENGDEDKIDAVDSLKYDFSTIKVATNNFSIDNKLGQGGFGTVYKGKLPNGQDIAVKRLSKGSRQGEVEFKNEVLLVAKLQHRNLVRLLGFCLEGDERLLVYEFVPNSSLDNFIFDKIKHLPLNWEMRYKIIRDIARGILYLHEDSRLRIIHRDLKASNILLDANMNPKISDFGMARLFEVDQTQDNTSIVMGTFGYMAPEYVAHGHFSVKSDVYSFGVLVLEIISGQKNSCFHIKEETDYLLNYAWKNLMEGKALNLIDPVLTGSSREIIRCIHIGLLCVQENAADRPTIDKVLQMLTTSSMSLPEPSKPAFCTQNTTMELNNSERNPVQFSVNDDSITELDPR